MIGPIDGRGWTPGGGDLLGRLGNLLDGRFRPNAPDAPGTPQLPDVGPGAPGAGSQLTAVSSVNVHMEVFQMLQTIGGGLQNDRMLQLLVTLLILTALLQEQQSRSGEDAARLLELLTSGRGQNRQIETSWSSLSVSVDTEFSVTIGGAGSSATQPPPVAGGSLDVAA